MTVHQKKTLLEMFTDRTAGESYSENRLQTVETDTGDVALIAYGWAKIAEYDESRDAVKVFTGHKAINSQALSRYVNDAKRIAQERGKDIMLSGESPNFGKPNDGITFIGNYVSFSTDRSAVERDAVQTVVDSITSLT